MLELVMSVFLQIGSILPTNALLSFLDFCFLQKIFTKFICLNVFSFTLILRKSSQTFYFYLKFYFVNVFFGFFPKKIFNKILFSKRIFPFLIFSEKNFQTNLFSKRISLF